MSFRSKLHTKEEKLRESNCSQECKFVMDSQWCDLTENEMAFEQTGSWDGINPDAAN